MKRVGLEAYGLEIVENVPIEVTPNPYNDNLLLPPCLGDFIPQNDPVRVVHRIIEQNNNL